MRDTCRWNLPPDSLIASSLGRNWSGIRAERRSHAAGELLEVISNAQTVVGIAIRGNRQSIIHRRGNEIRQATRALPGTVWLCPQGAVEDSIRITEVIPEMLHIYLPGEPFAALAQQDGFTSITPECVDYHAGMQDPLIAQIAALVLDELMAETSSGRLLVESAALTLAAQLVHRYSGLGAPHAAVVPVASGLGPRRLRRVLDFIEANLETDFSVADLARVAFLSQYHFSRAFKQDTGKSPHRYLSDRRLEHAKALLLQGEASLATIAQMCNFSSQGNFTRAFVRVVGMAPGEYRRRSR